MKPKLTFLLPCLNEKSTILPVIQDIKTNAKKYLSGKYEILIADNGSTDGTLRLLRKLKSIRVVSVPVRGYGAALHWGILASRSDYILFADSDLSYPFSNLPGFIKAMARRPDLVLGSRLTGKISPGAMPFLNRYLGTPILNWFIKAIYGFTVSDCNSGMRLVKKSFYRQLHLHNSGMEWASELLLKTALKHGKYFEIPIVFHKDGRDRPPHLSRWADGWRHLKTIVLLRPQSLYFGFILFLALAVVCLPFSFSLTFLFLSLTYVLLLCLLALHLMGAALHKNFTPLDLWLSRFDLVPLTAAFLLVVTGLTLIISDSHLGTKLFLVNIQGLTLMWLFLVETIKTHLINRLPSTDFPSTHK